MKASVNTKVLLIGASGKLGRSVFEALKSQGKYDIAVLSRRIHQLPVEGHLVAFHGDILLHQSLKTPVLWADVVINCSGLVSYRRTDKKIIEKVNIEGVRNLAAVCTRYNKRLIHTSSAVFYGSTNQPLAFKEEDQYAETYRGVYASSKFIADKIVMLSGCHYIILRPGTLVTTLSRLYKLYKRGWEAGLKGGASFAFIGEVAKAYVKAVDLIMEDTDSQVFNLGGTNLHFKEVFETFKKVHPRKTRFLTSKIIGSLSLVNDFLIDPFFGKTIVSRENYLTGSRFTFINSEKAKEQLDYRIPCFETTLKHIVEK
jgi:dihydroflavonol-4-reductase